MVRGTLVSTAFIAGVASPAAAASFTQIYDPAALTAQNDTLDLAQFATDGTGAIEYQGPLGFATQGGKTGTIANLSGALDVFTSVVGFNPPEITYGQPFVQPFGGTFPETYAGDITFTFDQAVAGFGISMQGMPGLNLLSVTINGQAGPTYSRPYAFSPDTARYMGVVSDAYDITSVTFTAVNTYTDGLYADMFRLFGTMGLAEQPPVAPPPPPASDVPEPASWMMLILGFGFVGGALRSRAGRGAWGRALRA